MALSERAYGDFTTPVRFDEDDVVVEVRGELDVATAPLLQDLLDQLVAEGARRVSVDLAETSFVDSTGLGALLAALRRMQAHHGRLVLRNPRPAALRLLEVTALEKVFTIEASV